MNKYMVSLWMMLVMWSTVAVAQERATALSAAEFATQAQKSLILDTRQSADFLKGFITGSINIGWKGPFDSWIQKILKDKNEPIILVTTAGTELDVLTRLDSLGYTQINGYLAGGVDNWISSGKSIAHIPNISAEEAVEWGALKDHVYVDVRTAKEFDAGHVDHAQNYPLVDRDYDLKVDPLKTYLLQCQIGYRSTLAASLLFAKGVKNIKNVDGGYKAVSSINPSQK